MLYLIGVWLVLLWVCLVIGTGCVNALSGDVRLRSGDRVMLALWFGTIALAVLLMLISLFGPLQPGGWTLAVLVLLGLTNRLAWRGAQPLWPPITRSQLGLGLGAVGLMAAVMSRSVSWHDAGYYHASAIQWLAQYGSVHGIALLFNNLGFTSSWFAFVAPLSAARVAQMSIVGNGFAALLLLLHWLLVTQRLLRRTGAISDGLMWLFASGALGLGFVVAPFSQVMLSPSPDFPVLVLVGTIAWALLWIGQLDGLSQSRLMLVPLILALGAVGMKLTAIPTLVVAGLFGLWHGWRSGRTMLLGLGLTIVMLGPNIASSLLTSGCPLYPSAVLCLDLPWALTSQAAHKVAAGTHDWVSWYGTPPAGMYPWFWAVTQLLKNSRDRLTFLGIGLGGVAGLVVLWRTWQEGRRSTQSLPGEFWVMLLGVVGIGFLLLTSIFTRFLLPYILLLFGLVGAWLLARPPLVAWGDRASASGRWLADKGLYLGLTSVASGVMLVNLVQYQGQNALLPPPLPQSTIVQKTTNAIVYSAPLSGDLPIGEHSRYTAEQLDRCWAAPIPCAYTIGPEIQLRDPKRGIAAGFERRSGH